MRLRFLGLASLAAIAVLMAGCGGPSGTPGIGGSGGLGTPGAGTDNPDATLFFRLKGDEAGDFRATDLVANTSFLGLQVVGTAEAGVSGTETTRTTTILFQVTPVKGQTYTLSSDPSAPVTVVYTERATGGTATSTWNATAGSVHVDDLTATHLDGTLSATLTPLAPATGTLTASSGVFHVKYQGTTN